MTFRTRYPGLAEVHYTVMDRAFPDQTRLLEELRLYSARRFLDINQTGETMEAHRERLQRLALHARAMLRDFRKLDGLLPELRQDGPLAKGELLRTDALVRDVETLIEAADACEDPKELRRIRHEDPGRRKQRPRGPSRDLWPFLISLCVEKGIPLSASEGSTLLGVTRAAHEALGLKSPSPTSLARLLKEQDATA